MEVSVEINRKRVLGERNSMLYGHFIEHFHRQIYGGIYDPGHPLADEDGFRRDIIDAMKHIRVPVLRWPGGCFVSSYHWKKAVGPTRTPFFDKAWRVEDPNLFGTDEFIRLCRKIGCEPYICTNAGTGTPEEMSDWVEYCNLKDQGEYARLRIRNGFEQPHRVPFWSIGNENYGHWELGAWEADEWRRIVRESAKMMRHVDPTIQLSAAARSDVDWNVNLLKSCGPYLDWISLHRYWDMMPEEHTPATYEECMVYTNSTEKTIRETRGILAAFGLEKKIRIAFDEWNLRSWHHPCTHTIEQGVSPEEYLFPRDKNDDNATYTMADAVFTACFLNGLNRNCDIVGMANFAPILNTRGCIYSCGEGIVLRSTYHVFDLYVNHLGGTVLDSWAESGVPELCLRGKNGVEETVPVLDFVATEWKENGKTGVALAVVNKHPSEPCTLHISGRGNAGNLRGTALYTVNGPDKDSYNDVGRNEVTLQAVSLENTDAGSIVLEPHSVNVIHLF